MEAKTKSTLGDLNMHLFEQLERLNDEGLTGEELQQEITRAKAVTGVASQIVANASLVLDAQKFQAEYHGKSKVEKTPRMLEG